MSAEDIVVGFVALHGGRVAGRTRLQKQIYLLDRCGGNFRLEYTYHHYGPYSFLLAGACASAEADGRITTQWQMGHHGLTYMSFELAHKVERPERLGNLSAERARSLLEKMKPVSDIVIELAATIIFLRDEWKCFGGDRIDAVEETKRRKPIKASENRLSKALYLLGDLDLQR